ncbi:MAG: hypothetical protein M1820_007203 [Bogoriella megaspora]|nr:MAG: hypothetical protein M1820_007203 [Bogoriella megaspora]
MFQPRSRIRSPSQRNPDLSWQNNHADMIELQLRDDGHRTWGFVIFRTPLGSDTDWAEFLRRLRYQMEDTFDYFNGRDVLDNFTLTVFEERAYFEGASSDTIRRHFQQWSLTAYRTEQQPDDDSENQIGISQSPRYHFAVQVDADALHSVVHDAPALPEIDVTKKGWVRLIDKSWYLGRYANECGLLEPIEGVTEDDVGWMKDSDPLETSIEKDATFLGPGVISADYAKDMTAGILTAFILE